MDNAVVIVETTGMGHLDERHTLSTPLPHTQSTPSPHTFRPNEETAVTLFYWSEK